MKKNYFLSAGANGACCGNHGDDECDAEFIHPNDNRLGGFCTRVKGHTGVHIACGFAHGEYVWRDTQAGQERVKVAEHTQRRGFERALRALKVKQ